MAIKYGIYALFRQGGSGDLSEARYIGKGRYPSRPRGHGLPSNMSRYAHLPVVCWIRSLRAVQRDYTWTLLEAVDKNLGSETERQWIARAKKLGARLLNCTDGGEGMLGWVAGIDTRQKRSQNAKRLWADSNFQAHQTLARVAGWASETRRLERSRSQGGQAFWDQNGIRYETLHQAARLLGLSAGNIRHVLTGRYRHTGGYHFFHYDPNLEQVHS